MGSTNNKHLSASAGARKRSKSTISNTTGIATGSNQSTTGGSVGTKEAATETFRVSSGGDVPDQLLPPLTIQQINSKIRKQSDPVGFLGHKSSINDRGKSHLLKGGKNSNDNLACKRLSVGSGASTQLSSTTLTANLPGVGGSTSSVSPDTQASPEMIPEEKVQIGAISKHQSGTPCVRDYRRVMEERFNSQYLSQLPEVDMCDFNSKETYDCEQATPEYAHEVYKLLLEQEVPLLNDYFATKQGNALALAYRDKLRAYGENPVRAEDRDHAVCRILELCAEKGYRKETHLLAVSILDRYLQLTHQTEMSRERLPLLVTTATIIAAKIEQPMTPSIRRMIKLLTEEEQQYVDKEGVIQLEQQILTLLDFDFNGPSTLTFLERFLRVADLNTDIGVCSIAEDLLKVAASRSCFLNFRPSHIAASALVLALCFDSIKELVLHLGQSSIDLKSSTKYDAMMENASQKGMEYWDENVEETTNINSADFSLVLNKLCEVARTSPILSLQQATKPAS